MMFLKIEPMRPTITGPKTNLMNLDARHKELSIFVAFHNLKLINTVTNANGKTLDLIIVPEESNYSFEIEKEDNPLVLEDTHHPAIVIKILTLYNPKKVWLPEKAYYDFKKCNFLNLTLMIRDCNWQNVLDTRDCNEAVDQFYRNIYEILDTVVPLKKNRHRKYPTWFTNEIIQLVKRKKHLHTLKTLSDYHNNEYKDVRRRLRSLTDITYRNFLHDTENSINSNTNAFWTYVKHKQTKDSTQQIIKHDGVVVENNLAAETFGQYFKSVYTINKANYQTSSLSEHTAYNNFDIFHLSLISETDYNNAIKRLKPKKAAGPDMIPPYILKGCADLLKKPLLHIFNLAIKNADFPNVWKESIIIPLHKSGPKSIVNNYRPIALISSPAKLFEQILYNKLFNHIKPCINEAQHGFLTNKSTITNLSVFTNNIYEALEDKQQVDVIYTDFQKAFDKVDHDILLRKLAQSGLSRAMLEFFASYLRSRSFVVRFNGNVSGKFEPNSGVPQGSNLGPLLFLIFINDLPEALRFSKSLLFADDQKMFLNINTHQDCLHLQSDINSLYDWSNINNLPINTEKCNILTFSRNKSPILHNYQMGGVSIKRVDIIKDLGVTYDNKLNFKRHVQHITLDSYRLLGFIIRQSYNFRNINTLKRLYTSLVRPKLEYASTIWYPSTIGSIKEIEKVQNKFLRHLYFKDFGTYPDYRTIRSSYLRNLYEMQSLENRRNINLMQFGFKLWNNAVHDSYLLSLLKLKVPERFTRSSIMFSIPTVSFTFHSPLLVMFRLLNHITITDGVDLNAQNYRQFTRLLISHYKYD